MHDFKKFPELTNNQIQFYYFQSPHRQILEGFMAKVVQVTDGDTIRVKWSERDFDFPVRLANINASELVEHGLASAEWLKRQIQGEEVYIQIDPDHRVGKFGRILG
ncbi:MAG: thermonuclease family protein, partial [Candidatus Heimdallarchaeaceae archaeon]